MTGQKDKQAHTALPWGVHCLDNGQIVSEEEFAKKTGMPEATIGHVLCCYPVGKDTAKAINKANAEFIVRACNNHYELAETLEKVLKIAQIEFEEHCEEYGMYDPSTGATEFSGADEDQNNDLYKRLESMEKIITPVLTNIRAGQGA